MKVTAEDGFYAEFEILTQLEQLDLDISEDDSESFIFASEIAECVSNWNGIGKVDPLWLLSDRKNHKYIYLISRAIDKSRIPLPVFQVKEQNDYLLLDTKNFYAKVKNLTILEFMDLISNIRKLHKDDLKSMFKCIAISRCIIDWNGQGEITPEQLHSNKDNHPYLMAVDTSISDFFRKEKFTISDNNPVLASGNNNGGDDFNKSSSLEPVQDFDKRISFNVERVQNS